MTKQEKQEEQTDTQEGQTQESAGEQEQAGAETAVKTAPPPVEDNRTNESSRGETSSVPGSLRRRQLLIGGAGLLASAATLGGLLWVERPRQKNAVIHPTNASDRLVVFWNNAALEAIRALQPPMPVVARALAIVHTCMYDAWAAYHPTAFGTQFIGLLRRPFYEQTLNNK